MREHRGGLVIAWAQDMMRGACERPLWARLLLRVALGKDAYREWIGVMESLEAQGYLFAGDYGGLKHMEWHDDTVPLDFLKAVHVRDATESNDMYEGRIRLINEQMREARNS